MMGYANPIERFGYDAFASACAEAGVDLITVDLPPEEVGCGWTSIFSTPGRLPDARVKKMTITR